MPVSIKRDPFSGQPIIRSDLSLRTPQARLLAALMPDDPTWPVSEWPIVTRSQLGVLAGYTAISGTVTRALNGIKKGSSSGEPYPGLLARGFVSVEVYDIDGIDEVNYRITATGIRAYQAHVAAQGGGLPQVRDAGSCINNRYQKKTEETKEGT